MHLQVDGDIILYRSAGAAQHTYYELWSHGEYVTEFDNAKSGKAALKDQQMDDPLAQGELIPRIDLLSPEEADQILEDYFTGLDEHFNNSPMTIYVSGEDNFRYDVGTMVPYKWSRNPYICEIYGRKYQQPPYYYQQLKARLLERVDVVTTVGMEADDAMGIAQLKDPDNSCIVSLDKDLDQIPGRHFDLLLWEEYDVNKRRADQFLYQQILTGDSTDCIPGIKGMGEKTARKVLQGCESTRELFEECVERWKGYADKLGGDYTDAKDMMIETAKLVYILRSDSPDEYTKFERLFDKYESHNRRG